MSRPTYLPWCGVWKGGRTDLVITERDYTPPQKGSYSYWSYQEALREGLLPVYDGTQQFQQDNAKIHRSISTTEWILSHGIEVLENWPAHSPDLNPIWALLKSKLKAQYPDIWELKKKTN